MINQIIVTLLIIPVRALFLWIFTGLQFNKEMFLKALITSFVIFSVFLVLKLIELKGFHAESIQRFLRSLYFQAPFCLFVLKKVYRFDWLPTVLVTAMWMVTQIPINILQIKVYDLLF